MGKHFVFCGGCIGDLYRHPAEEVGQAIRRACGLSKIAERGYILSLSGITEDLSVHDWNLRRTIVSQARGENEALFRGSPVEFWLAVSAKQGRCREECPDYHRDRRNDPGHGHTHHGLVIFPYFEQNIPDPIDPSAEPEVVKESGAGAVIDGNFGFAQLALSLAKDLAVAKASKQGVALVTVRKRCWFGALGPYLYSIAEQGYMAQLWAQTTTCRDAAPYGGIDAKFSTNPIALAFPTASTPVVSDFSTTTISMGKTKRMAQSGQKAPEPIFLDSSGNLSSDADVALKGGSVLFIGGAHYGYKGYGLSLWSEGIAALAGGECNESRDTKTSQSASLTVIDPRAFAGHEYFYSEIERFKTHMLNSRPRPDRDDPPARSEGCRQSAGIRREGDPGTEGLLETLNALAEAQRIPVLSAE